MNEELKKKVKEMAKERGLDIAEESVEAACNLAVDVIKELCSANILAASVFASVEPIVREKIKEIDLDGDGE